MKLDTKEFQDAARDKIVLALTRAQKDWLDQTLCEQSAIVLSAPTGSGKTIIATDVIERLIYGTDDLPRDGKAVFLWLTYQPGLNEQTLRKMLKTSSHLTKNDLVTISPERFVAEKLTAGKVYFINAQKLSGAGLLLSRRMAGNKRRAFTFWETMTNTIDDRGLHLYLVIDEAHQGMGQTRDQDKKAESIVQRFLIGSGEMPAVPVVLGISATPARFNHVLGTTERSTKPVNVKPEEVRGSGLIVEEIRLISPDQQQMADITLLRAATKKWVNLRASWRQYCASQQIAMVEPILIVQVEDSPTPGRLSASDLDEAIRAIKDEDPSLSERAFVHAFQEHTPVEIGHKPVRWVAAPDIETDPEARVVLFKTALNTGWDCPRASMMFSFRKVEDKTAVGQLVGRMVRTPLARKIAGHDDLNSVEIYLPRYDRAAVDEIVKYLTDSGEAPGATGEPTVDLLPIADSEEAIAALNAIKTEVVPRLRKMSNIRRLCLLADALSLDHIDTAANRRERGVLVERLLAEHQTRLTDAAYVAQIRGDGILRVRVRAWTTFELLTDEDNDEFVEIPVSAENVNDLYERAGKGIDAEVAKEYWRRRIEVDADARATGRREVIALVNRPEIINHLESAAQERVSVLRNEHAGAIKKVSDSRKAIYEKVDQSSATPIGKDFEAPTTIEVKAANPHWNGHLYRTANGQAPISLGPEESDVIRAEMGRQDFVGWLRNIDRREWALTVSFVDEEGLTRPFYPDFLVVRRVGKALKVDIIDPHNPLLPDGVGKAQGLARFARTYGDSFGRIETIAIVDHQIKRINLQDEGQRQDVFRATTGPHLRSLFR